MKLSDEDRLEMEMDFINVKEKCINLRVMISSNEERNKLDRHVGSDEGLDGMSDGRLSEGLRILRNRRIYLRGKYKRLHMK